MKEAFPNFRLASNQPPESSAYPHALQGESQTRGNATSHSHPSSQEAQTDCNATDQDDPSPAHNPYQDDEDRSCQSSRCHRNKAQSSIQRLNNTRQDGQ